MPLLLAASVLPDIDLILSFVVHRGPTHSLVTSTVLMIPFFAVYRKRAIPYYAALLSHILIGDFFTGGIQLFWPLSQSWFGALYINVRSLPNVVTEFVLFCGTLPLMYKLGDLQTLWKIHNKNWALIVPIGAILEPLVSIFPRQDIPLSILVVAPSLFYVVLFAYALLFELRRKLSKNGEKPPQTPIVPPGNL